MEKPIFDETETPLGQTVESQEPFPARWQQALDFAMAVCREYKSIDDPYTKPTFEGAVELIKTILAD